MDSTKHNNNEARRALCKVHFAFARRSGRDIIHPVIRIGGKYLQEFGFAIGDEIEVRCENGRILITKLKPNTAPGKKSKAR